jgi:phosphoribosylformylglycinamidine synthase
MVVAESTLNVACAGARPVALVNCLNFGNPEHPEVMWQLSEAIDGMAEACRALGLPVIGGNVSLYNESRGRDIDPTPVVAVLGLIEHLERRPPSIGFVDGGPVLLLGEPRRELAGSRWAAGRGHHGGILPQLDLAAHARLLGLVAGLAGDGVAAGLHDVADGGLALCLAEMALASGVGCQTASVPDHAVLFSEASSRVVVCVADEAAADEVTRRAGEAQVPVERLGRASGDRLVIDGLVDESLVALREFRGATRSSV